VCTAAPLPLAVPPPATFRVESRARRVRGPWGCASTSIAATAAAAIAEPSARNGATSAAAAADTAATAAAAAFVRIVGVLAGVLIVGVSE